jgi:hypothetical protein
MPIPTSNMATRQAERTTVEPAAVAGHAEAHRGPTRSWTKTATHLCLRTRNTIRRTSARTRTRFRYILCKARGETWYERDLHFYDLCKSMSEPMARGCSPIGPS